MNNNHSLIAKHAKSFSWAGFFLSKETFRKCSVLYDFCRTIDDIADQDSQLDSVGQEAIGLLAHLH